MMVDGEQNDNKRLSPLARAVQASKSVLKDIAEDCGPVALAMGRQGAGELGTFFAKPFPDSFGPSDAIGTPYNPTQMQVSQEVGLYGESPVAGDAKAEVTTEPMNGAAAKMESPVPPHVNNEPEIEP